MSEVDLISPEEDKVTDIGFWKDLVRDSRTKYNELETTGKEIESQLEMMYMDANDDAERAKEDLK